MAPSPATKSGGSSNSTASAPGSIPRPLHVHVLRHTAAMLYNEGGSDLATISRLLHHSNPAITGIYLHAMAGGRNPDWAKAYAQLPGLQSSLYEDPDE